MQYYYSKKLTGDFDSVIDKVVEALKAEGFGVLTEIDVKATFKKKLDKDFKNYRILGACNPGFAFQALTHEDKVGAMLPCNVVVIEQPDGKIEVAAVNPIASMNAIENNELGNIANEVKTKLEKVVDNL